MSMNYFYIICKYSYISLCSKNGPSFTMKNFDEHLSMLKFIKTEEKKKKIVNFGYFFCKKGMFVFKKDNNNTSESKKMRF